MPSAGRVTVLLLFSSIPAPALTAQAPTFQQISGYIEGGLEALGRGDTAGYRTGTGRAFAVAPEMPPVAYHHARALALSGETDSAVILLERLAWQGAVATFDAPSDSAFAGIAASPAWRGVIGKIELAKGPISHSSPAFELPERDLTAEGTAWDSKTGTLFLSSLYKRKIVAIGPTGAARDLIAGGQDGIGPVVGLEVDPLRRGLWAASMVLPEAGIPLADSSLAAHGLIAHQPTWFQRVVRLRLDRRQERVASWETIERHHPRFAQPTTGEVAGDDYYYIANAQLRRFRDGKIFPWDSLDPVLVLKTRLR